MALKSGVLKGDRLTCRSSSGASRNPCRLIVWQVSECCHIHIRAVHVSSTVHCIVLEHGQQLLCKHDQGIEGNFSITSRWRICTGLYSNSQNIREVHCSEHEAQVSSGSFILASACKYLYSLVVAPRHSLAQHCQAVLTVMLCQRICHVLAS